jgi:formylmethanofuran dehydrogenase subunit E
MSRTQRVRQVQHKPSDKENNKELAEVKRENQQLKRKIAKLQKQLQKLMDLSLEVAVEEPIKIENVENPDISKCQSCGSVSLRTVSLPNGTLNVCKDCGKKELVKRTV